MVEVSSAAEGLAALEEEAVLELKDASLGLRRTTLLVASVSHPLLED